MNCPKCGAQLADGSSFCGGCGNRLRRCRAQRRSSQPATRAPAEFTLTRIPEVRAWLQL